ERGNRGVLAGCHLQLGLLHASTGDPRQAEQAFRQAIDLANRAHGEQGRSFHPSLGATAQHELGKLLPARGQTEKAEAAYRQAVALAETQAQLFPDLPSYRQALTGFYAALAGFLEKNGQRDEATVCKRAACAQLAKLVADFPEGIGESAQSA